MSAQDGVPSGLSAGLSEESDIDDDDPDEAFRGTSSQSQDLLAHGQGHPPNRTATGTLAKLSSEFTSLSFIP